MIRGWAILLLLQGLGELLAQALHLPLPGSVIGMILLLLGLRAGLIRVEWVKDAAELLLSHLSLLFVPAGVGVMLYFDLIAGQWWPLTIATVGSTFVVLAVTGWTTKLLSPPENNDVC
ncbi:MAG: CidA/LrgA family protein [Desulfuromonadaceae bacterium]|nr:CidA/LrgA family protein [Desulfuromonadaceae bacterium]